MPFSRTVKSTDCSRKANTVKKNFTSNNHNHRTYHRVIYHIHYKLNTSMIFHRHIRVLAHQYFLVLYNHRYSFYKNTNKCQFDYCRNFFIILLKSTVKRIFQSLCGLK